MPEASVVIPTYNRKELLDQALETVQVQTYEPLECIVVDDGSTDGTREFLEGLDYDALRTIYHDENRGQSLARSAGIEAASGEYVLFLDSDDIFYPHAAETLVEALEEQPEGCAGAFSSTKYVNSRGRVRRRTVPEGKMVEATLENAESIGGFSGTIFRRNSLNEVGRFDESLPRRTDVDLYLKLLNRYTLLGVDEICCECRIHDSGASSDKEKVKKSYRIIAEKHQLEDSRYD